MTRNEILEICNQFYTEGNATEREVAFARFIMEHERNECAKIVELNADACRSDGVSQMIFKSNAEAIRARGEA